MRFLEGAEDLGGGWEGQGWECECCRGEGGNAGSRVAIEETLLNGNSGANLESSPPSPEQRTPPKIELRRNGTLNTKLRCFPLPSSQL